VLAGSRNMVIAGGSLLGVAAVLAALAAFDTLRAGLPALAWAGRYGKAGSSPSGSPEAAQARAREPPQMSV
jgi:hypothetical protein